MERHIEWSPASCDVNVNRLSLGPLVLTTTWEVATSWVLKGDYVIEGNCAFGEGDEEEKTIYLNLHYYTQIRVCDVFLLRLLPL